MRRLPDKIHSPKINKTAITEDVISNDTKEIDDRNEILTPVQTKEVSDQVATKSIIISQAEIDKEIVYQDDIFELKKVNVGDKKAQKKDKQLMAQNM